MDHKFLHLRGELASQLVKCKFRAFNVQVMELGCFYGLTVDDSQHLPVPGVIGELKTYWNNFGLEAETKSFFSLESHPADAFFQLAEAAEAGMITFRKDDEAILISQYINCFIEYLIITFHRSETIPDPVYRENFDEIEKRGNEFFSENICPAKKNHLSLCCKQDCQSIHQGILMVRGEDQVIIMIDIFPSQDNNLSVKNIVMPDTCKILQQSISPRILLNVFPAHTGIRKSGLDHHFIGR